MYLVWWYIMTCIEIIFWPAALVSNFFQYKMASYDRWFTRYMWLKSTVGFFVIITTLAFCLGTVPWQALPIWIRADLMAGWIFYVLSAKSYYDTEVKPFA